MINIPIGIDARMNMGATLKTEHATPLKYYEV
jgi:hypothetical protein